MNGIRSDNQFQPKPKKEMEQMEDPTTTDTETESKPNGAGKIRSETPYPYYGLTKVIEIVQAVRRAGGNDAAPATDVLREMKIAKTTDRLWAYGIPAAIYFGLIERIGRGDDARVKLTPLGLRIALPGTPDEERATKVAVLKAPELYSKLLEQFAGHPVPSKEVLRNILQRDFKIVESMAGNAADAFLDSLKVADLITPTGSIAALDGSAPPATADKPDKPAPEDVAPPGMQTVLVPADFIIYRCKIGKGRVIEIPLPPEFTQTDVKRLYAFLQTQVDDSEGDE